MKETRANGEKSSYRERVWRTVMELDMPVYAVFDVPRIELTGDGRLLVERHHGILEYGGECIRIAAKGLVIRITGMDLCLQAMNQNEISVTGLIAGIELLK